MPFNASTARALDDEGGENSGRRGGLDPYLRFQFETADEQTERDLLITLGAPPLFATLCALTSDQVIDDRSFLNCNCPNHDWYITGVHRSILPRWTTNDPRANRVGFALECSGNIYFVPTRIHRSSGSISFLGVYPSRDQGRLPGFMLPVGRFMQTSLDISLRCWDVRHLDRVRGTADAPSVGVGDTDEVFVCAGRETIDPAPAEGQRDEDSSDSSDEEGAAVVEASPSQRRNEGRYLDI